MDSTNGMSRRRFPGTTVGFAGSLLALAAVGAAPAIVFTLTTLKNNPDLLNASEVNLQAVQ